MTETANTAETRKHIAQVGFRLHQVAVAISERALVHDESKLHPPEAQVFEEYTPRLAEVTYGSAEYAECLAGMKPALDHHYATNRHHPEHHEDGVRGMTLVDLVEMLADWKAATERHADGSMTASLAHNAERFDIPPALAQVLDNTVAALGWAS